MCSGVYAEKMGPEAILICPLLQKYRDATSNIRNWRRRLSDRRGRRLFDRSEAESGVDRLLLFGAESGEVHVLEPETKRWGDNGRGGSDNRGWRRGGDRRSHGVARGKSRPR